MISFKGRNIVLRDNEIKNDYIDYDMPQDLKEVLLKRGIKDLQKFMKPSLMNSMPHPFTLKGMEQAVERIIKAVKNNERIAIYGDYDVDGATSTAILIRFLRMIGYNNTTFYIPQRLTEGYGPNSNAMDYLKKDGVSVVMVVDSGTTAYVPLEYAHSIGLDIVILDHHKPDGALNEDGTPRIIPAILVNPKRFDEDGQYDYLCTAGLAFWFIVGMRKKMREMGYLNTEPDIRPLLGLVALGTVCDMVPLKDLNRAYVKVGLEKMIENPGLRKLSEITGENSFHEHSCGFVFGPCINAGGRISDTMLGSKLLTTDDEEEAEKIAQLLFELNKERKAIQDAAIEEAMNMVSAKDNYPVVILYNEKWHPGIVGLVASRIKDSTDKPCIIIGEKGKGSARADHGFDIGQAIINARQAGLLIAGGGHMAAGGLTLEPSKLDEFEKFIIEEFNKSLLNYETKVDLIMPIDKFDTAILNDLDIIRPVGIGNPSVKFYLTGGLVRKASRMGKDDKKDKHIKITLTKNNINVDVILWNGTGTPMGNFMENSVGEYLNVVTHKIKLNIWNGRSILQIEPEDFIKVI